MVAEDAGRAGRRRGGSGVWRGVRLLMLALLLSWVAVPLLWPPRCWRTHRACGPPPLQTHDNTPADKRRAPCLGLAGSRQAAQGCPAHGTCVPGRTQVSRSRARWARHTSYLCTALAE